MHDFIDKIIKNCLLLVLSTRWDENNSYIFLHETMAIGEPLLRGREKEIYWCIRLANEIEGRYESLPWKQGNLCVSNSFMIHACVWMACIIIEQTHISVRQLDRLQQFDYIIRLTHIPMYLLTTPFLQGPSFYLVLAHPHIFHYLCIPNIYNVIIR